VGQKCLLGAKTPVFEKGRVPVNARDAVKTPDGVNGSEEQRFHIEHPGLAEILVFCHSQITNVNM
jgi:hypothetical protein